MKVGDYVRTKRGLIGKIININTFREPCMKYGIEASYLDDIWFIGDDDIKIVKENPIDLIEPGDYANGMEVTRIDGTYHGRKDKAIYCDYCVNKETGKQTMIYDDEIKSIVTKEQIESIKYEVEQ